MDEFLELIFDVFDETDQRAAVRASLKAAQLVEEIIREFAGLDARQRESYALTLAGNEQPLVGYKSLAEQGVQSGDRLTFGWLRSGQTMSRHPVSTTHAELEELSQGVVFAIRWQPALIGRPDTDPAHNELLAVDVTWLPGSQRVSRQQAQLTEQRGVFYVRSLTEQNPTLLNGRKLQPHTPVALQDGDRIQLGTSDIVLRFRLPAG